MKYRVTIERVDGNNVDRATRECDSQGEAIAKACEALSTVEETHILADAIHKLRDPLWLDRASDTFKATFAALKQAATNHAYPNRT